MCDGRVTLLAGPTPSSSPEPFASFGHVVSNRVGGEDKKGSTRSKRDNLATLRSYDADSNENLKNISKTTILQVHHASLYISLPLLARLRRVKMPNFAFYGVRKEATTKFISLSELECGP